MKPTFNEVFSSSMTGHIEEDFLLRGRQAPLREKTSGYLTNSQITLTTQRLSQTTQSGEDGSWRVRRSLENGTDSADSGVESTEDKVGLREKSPSLEASSMLQALTISDSYLGESELSPTAGLGFNGYDHSDSGFVAGNESHPSLHSPSVTPKSPEDQWFTRPSHLDKASISLMTKAVQPLPVSDTPLLSSNDPSFCSLAQEYFPMTLGGTFMMHSVEPETSPGGLSADALASRTVSLSNNTSLRPSSAPQKHKHHPKSSSRRRPGSAHSARSSSSKSSVDKLYRMAAEVPQAGSNTVLLSSPYQCDLARLRMDRLRIEEEHILELKRQEELERIRGPQPKWYEMTSPQFHYEAHKNSELMRNKESWQELMDYRTELLRASKKFQKKYTAANFQSTS